MSLYDPHNVSGMSASDLGFPPEEYITDINIAYKRASQEDLTIVTASDTMLQLDFDTEEQYDVFMDDGLSKLVSFFGVKRAITTESRSGNKHVYIHLYKPLPPFARIALQALLGSDPKRELMNLIREASMQDGQGILLFETLQTEPVVIYATDGYQPMLTDGGQQLLLTAGAQ